MANETLARRYALAIFQLAQEAGALEGVRTDLHSIRGAIEGDETAKRFFVSPVVDRKEKERVLATSFASVHEIALNALLLLVRKRREALLGEIVRQFDDLEMQTRGAETLTIASAKELTKEQLSAVVARLEALYGKRFDATQRVDPELLGGVRVTMGDRRIDGSVEGRLEELTRTLFAKQ